MDFSAKKRAIQGKMMYYLITIAVLIGLFIVLGTSYSWFVDNTKTYANNFVQTASGVDMMRVAAYDTDGTLNDTTHLFQPELLPGKSVTIALFAQSNTGTNLNFAFDFTSLAVNYYEIQKYNTDSVSEAENPVGEYSPYQLEKKMKNQISAGPYMTAGGELDYHDITLAQYLQFLKPLSNAVRVYVDRAGADLNSTALAAYTGYAAAGYETIEEYAAASLINAYNFDPANVGAGVESGLLCATGAQDVAALNIPQNTYIDLTGTMFGTNNDTIGTDIAVYYITFYFDPLIYSSATLNIDSVDTAVELQNSNPFMHQKLWIKSITYIASKVN